MVLGLFHDTSFPISIHLWYTLFLCNSLILSTTDTLTEQRKNIIWTFCHCNSPISHSTLKSFSHKLHLFYYIYANTFVEHIPDRHSHNLQNMLQSYTKVIWKHWHMQLLPLMLYSKILNHLVVWAYNQLDCAIALKIYFNGSMCWTCIIRNCMQLAYQLVCCVRSMLQVV